MITWCRNRYRGGSGDARNGNGGIRQPSRCDDSLRTSANEQRRKKKKKKKKSKTGNRSPADGAEDDGSRRVANSPKPPTMKNSESHVSIHVGCDDDEREGRESRKRERSQEETHSEDQNSQLNSRTTAPHHYAAPDSLAPAADQAMTNNDPVAVLGATSAAISTTTGLNGAATPNVTTTTAGVSVVMPNDIHVIRSASSSRERL